MSVVDLEAERAKRDFEPDIPPPPMPPGGAAKRFLAWLQAGDDVGDMPWSGRKGLWQMYLLHCAEEQFTPLPENRLAEAFGKLARKRLVRDRSNGKLQRLTWYAVPIPRKRAS